MKEGIHPDYKTSRVMCTCGNTFETRSTRGDFHVEICSNCHPFFTGKQKLMDTAGRIEKFRTRYAGATVAPAEKKAAPAAAPAKPAPKVESRAERRAKSVKKKPQPAQTEFEKKTAEAAATAAGQPEAGPGPDTGDSET